MKLTSIHQASLAAICSLIPLAEVHAVVAVDGTRDGGEGYAELHTQATQSGWITPNQSLANIHAKQEADSLFLHLAGRAGDGVLGNAVILFLDTKAGGVNKITNNLITSGDEAEYINNLGTSPTAGLTFESGFNADYAIRIYGNGGSDAYVNIYNLATGTRTYAGNSGAGAISSGIVSSLQTVWAEYVLAGYATANQGVEMALDLIQLGVSTGPQAVKMTAILINHNSTYGSNQVLGSRTSSIDDIGGGINTIDFESEAGTQTLSVNVAGPASRNVVFSVNMADEITRGNFTVGVDSAKALFFSGNASPGEILLTDVDADKIYTGTLAATGAEGAAFGNYKFFNTKAGAPNSGYEFGADRSFTLGPLSVTQTLPVVIFRPNSFSIWSNTYSGDQSATEDNDGDGIQNGLEYFMGSNNSAFTPNPQVVTAAGVKSVSWPHDTGAVGVTYKVWSSENLSVWTDVTSAAVDSGGTLKYTLPGLTPKAFVRLEVTP